MSDPKSLAGRPSTRADLLGQVFTPPSIAMEMVQRLFGDCNKQEVTLLDPCVGPGTFPEALREAGLVDNRIRLTAVDIDPAMIGLVRDWGEATGIPIDTLVGDYLSIEFISHFDCIILNPPYVRQEWIDDKQHYRSLFIERYGEHVPGTSNLYVYFIVKTLFDLKPGGRFICIVYDSWRKTQFGEWLDQFLARHCSRVEIGSALPQPFNGRLIDATIIHGTKLETGESSRVLKGRGDEAHVTAVSPMTGIPGFKPIQDLFATKRGLRLKQADFFLCDLRTAPIRGVTPFVKKVGKIRGFSVPDDHPEGALLLSSDGPDRPEVKAELLARMSRALENPTLNVPIITWHRERPNAWYVHREPQYAPIIFNYYLRSRPRHILNPQRPYSDNFYGVTPNDDGHTLAWLAALNSTCVSLEVLANSRRQGAGLAKIQLYEYRKILVPDITLLDGNELTCLEMLGESLIRNQRSTSSIVSEIDELISRTFGDERLSPRKLNEHYERVSAQMQPTGRGEHALADYS